MNELAAQLEGVGKDYPFFSLKDVRLHVPRGHIMGFIGPNGAGKSTTIRILMGLVHQDRGDVRLLGYPMPADQADAKRDVGFASEDMRLYDSATLGWHMQFIRSIYPKWDEAYAQLLLKRFDLKAEQRIKGLSHGQRVKATLLLVLARRPRVLLLDEPTTGLDPVARHEVLRELMDVMNDERRSILFSSHNTQDVEQISDLITFIDRGRIIDSRDKEASSIAGAASGWSFLPDRTARASGHDQRQAPRPARRGDGECLRGRVCRAPMKTPGSTSRPSRT